jgi:hypothetical protein
MSVPSIAWQSPGRNLVVSPVPNDLADQGGVRQMAAEWRLAMIIKEGRRLEVLKQMKSIMTAASFPVSTGLADATAIDWFHKTYNLLSPAQPTAASLIESKRLHDAASRLSGNHLSTRCFKRNFTKLYHDIWDTPIMYQVGDIPLSEVIIVRIGHVTKDSTVDFDSVVGRALFQLVEKRDNLGETHDRGTPPSLTVMPSNPLSPHARRNLRDLLNSETVSKKKNGNAEAAQVLIKDIRNDAVQVMNQGGMIRWILGHNICTENLFKPGFVDSLFRLFGLILKEHGNSQVMEDGTNKLVHFKATVLATIKEVKQRFHRDYSKSELNGRRPGAGPKPWSADIPLVKGGLYLNLWHGFDKKKGKYFVGNTNFTVHIPQG